MQQPARFHENTCFTLNPGPPDAPLVLLVHGVGLDQGMWHPWVEHLGRDFSLVTYDLYGHGRSGDPPGARNMVDFVDQVDELVRHIGTDRFVLAGFSLGAMISQAYASLRPGQLSHLVLLHGAYRRNEEQCERVRERYRAARERGPSSNIEQALKRWFTDPYRIAHPEAMARLREMFEGHGEGYLKAYRLFSHAESEMRKFRLSRVDCPALVLTGSDDVGSTPAMSERLAADLPRAGLIVNPGHRHMAPVEFAEMLCGQVKSFLCSGNPP